MRRPRLFLRRIAMLGLLIALLSPGAAPTHAQQVTLSPPNMLFPWDEHESYRFTSGSHNGVSIVACTQVALSGASGLDFAMSENQVLAVAPGKLGRSGTDPQIGKFVYIEHENGWSTGYWHLSSFDDFVKNNPRGTPVEQGRLLGISGTAGTGPHLHLELRYNGKPYSWHGVNIQGYTARAHILQSNSGLILNYQGTLTQGSEQTQSYNDTFCKNEISPHTDKYVTRWTGATQTIDSGSTTTISSTNKRVSGIGVLSPSQAKPLTIALNASTSNLAIELVAPFPSIDPNKLQVSIAGQALQVISVPRLADRFILALAAPQLGAGIYDLNISYEGQQISVPQSIRVVPASGNDVVLVIDRSGSMYGAKMNAARAAARQFIDLLQVGDRIGVIAFSDSASVAFPLTLINSAPDTTQQRAKAAIDALIVSGNTALGAGLNTGQFQLRTNGEPAGPQSIVLLTDGRENIVPAASEVLPAIEHTGTIVHTIGLGSDVDAALLSSMASSTHGIYRFASSPDVLLDVYHAMSSTVASRQTLLNEHGLLSVSGNQQHSVLVDSSVQEITIFNSWTGSSSPAMTLTSPAGTQISAQSNGQPGIHYFSGTSYSAYRISAPALSAGSWQINIGPVASLQSMAQNDGLQERDLTGMASDGGEAYSLETDTFQASSTPSYSIRVSGQSGITMRSYLGQRSPLTQIPLSLIVALADKGPILQAQLSATLSDSTGQQIMLIDDGRHQDGIANDGVYGGAFMGITQPGSYTIIVKAEGQHAGQSFTRLSEQDIYISFNPVSPIWLPLVVNP